MVRPCLYKKNTKISQACWWEPVIPATQEAEAGELLKPERRRLQWAKILPLHSSLGNKSETLSQKKKIFLMGKAVDAKLIVTANIYLLSKWESRNYILKMYTTNKHMKTCSASLVIREIQIKPPEIPLHTHWVGYYQQKTKIKDNRNNKHSARMWRSWCSRPLLVGMWNGTAAVEKSLVVL